MKSWKSISASIITGLVGLTAMGCSTPVISNVQESPQAKTNSAIANAQKAIPAPTTPNVDVGNSKGTEQPQVTLASSANKSQDLPLQSGRYWIGGTDQGLEIQGERYRYYDESETNKPWKPISDLKYIKDGVVFDGKLYWCLSTLPSKNGKTACSANGWVTREPIPFTGTRRFNFLGGSGTGQSITIESNGDTLVQLHGTGGISVIYSGEFSNPIVLDDGRKLLLEGDKIYILLLGQSLEECKSSGSPCQANLY
jgi:hypothetical protein